MGTMFRPEYLPATREIRDTFADEITTLGGTIPDAYDDGERLFARAVLPMDADVLPGDRICAGVAVRATGSEILVHPYTFRQICSNGAIVAHALETARIERAEGVSVSVPSYDAVVAINHLRAAIRACASIEAFSAATREMRSASEPEADVSIHLMSAVARMPAYMVRHLVPMIFDRFEAGGDRSMFGLMNAVTSVARDTRDPEVRWRLEELGGTMPARLQPKPKVTPAAGLRVSA